MRPAAGGGAEYVERPREDGAASARLRVGERPAPVAPARVLRRRDRPDEGSAADGDDRRGRSAASTRDVIRQCVASNGPGGGDAITSTIRQQPLSGLCGQSQLAGALCVASTAQLSSP